MLDDQLELRLQISEAVILRIFSEIEEYSDRKVINMDRLIRGMAAIATTPVQPGTNDPTTPLDVFVESLLKTAVEKGSTGIGPLDHQ